MFIGFTGTPLLKADKATSIETFGSLHPHLQVRRGRRGRRRARPALRGPQHRPGPDVAGQGRQVVRGQDQGHDRPVQGRAEEALGHDAEGRQLRAARQADRQRHPARHGDQASPDGRPRQRHAGRRRASTRPASSTSCSAKAGFKGKCAIVTSYEPQAGDISKEDSGEGATEKLRQYDIYRQMLADHFNEPADEAVDEGRAVREGGQGAVHQRARPDAAADRGRQAADRLRRAERDLPLHRQEDARPRPVPGDLPRQPARRRRQGLRLHRRLPGPLQLARRRDHRLHLRRARRLRRRRTSRGCSPTASRRPARTSTRPWSGSARSASRSRHRRTRCSTSSYFCATEQGNAEQLKANEPKRVELYKSVAALVRAYAQPRQRDGPTPATRDAEAAAIKEEVAHYVDVRDEVKLGAGENVDFKQYEAGMRFLLDTYIQAERLRDRLRLRGRRARSS